MMGGMRKTIKRHTDFVISDDDLMAKSAGLFIRVRPTRFPGDARYGLVTTKRTFRHAVERNRARRRIRAWLRVHEKMLNPDFDYVFIARTSINNWTYKDGLDAMRKALHFLSRQTAKKHDAK